MNNNNQDKILMTQDGLVALKEEYRNLKEVKRPALVDRMAGARSEGDLSENSEYIQSREELAFLDGRLEELDDILQRAQAVNNGGHNKCQTVDFGCKVTVKTSLNGEQFFYLVGEWEADPAQQKISHQSPLGKLLIGRKIGEKVEVEAPAGKVTYTILSIE